MRVCAWATSAPKRFRFGENESSLHHSGWWEGPENNVASIRPKFDEFRLPGHHDSAHALKRARMGVSASLGSELRAALFSLPHAEFIHSKSG